MEIADLRCRANAIRTDIIRMVGAAGSGHPGGSLSCTDILTALYFGEVLNVNPDDPQMDGRDYFILAKGHAAPALYATLAAAGFFPADELPGLRKWGSMLQGHPDCRLVPGVEVSTGSLGQGLSIAAGLAAGLKIAEAEDAEGAASAADAEDAVPAARPQTVFALLGDGECEEGQVWEAAMFAAHNGLDNLVAIVDHNGLQIDGRVADVCDPGDIGAKFAAFGWDAYAVDGHDMEAVVGVLRACRDERAGRPRVIVAETVKGKGVSFMEDQAGWHGKAPKGEELERALADLAQEARRLEAARADAVDAADAAAPAASTDADTETEVHHG